MNRSLELRYLRHNRYYYRHKKVDIKELLLFIQKLNHNRNKIKRLKQIFNEQLKRLFYEYVFPQTPFDGWVIIIPTFKDDHRIRMTLSWKFGAAALKFSDYEMLHHIIRRYKKYDRMDYYFRKYEEHAF